MLDALEQALHDRKPVSGALVHHSDRDVQYVSIKYTERLAEAGLVSSVGSVGDSYDNALAETINGLYKAEVIRRRGPWRSLDAVEYATLEWARGTVGGAVTGGVVGAVAGGAIGALITRNNRCYVRLASGRLRRVRCP